MEKENMCLTLKNNNTNFHKTYEIAPDILVIRCNTMTKLLNNLKSCYFDFQKEHIHKKLTRVAEYTKYGVRIATKHYTQYAIINIIAALDNFQMAVSTNNYEKAATYINSIMHEKNNYF